MADATTTDPYDLQRFLDAQDRVYAQVLAELEGGRKRSHWMWFVFPQIQGLGTSPTAMRFALPSADAARAYAGHPMLGARLRQCTRLVNRIEGRSIEEIFGYPDHLKFRSCMTLFAKAVPDEPVFREAIGKHFAGELDPMTLDRL